MVWVVGHRGASSDAPEHTLTAIDTALSQGAAGIEVDVRLTLDNQVILMHDATTRRVSQTSLRISKSPLKQLQQLDVGRTLERTRDTAGEGVQQHRVLTLFELCEVLEAHSRDVGLLVETKHPSANGKALEPYVVRIFQHFGLNKKRERTQPPVAVMSFSRAALQRVRSLDDNIETTLLLRAPLVGAAAHRLPTFIDSVGPGVHLLRRSSRWLTELQATDRAMYVWTVDTEADLARCLNLGVEAVITNRPGWAVQELAGTV